MPTSASALDDRIDNWKRWARSTGRSAHVCQSIESRYTSPQTWHPTAISIPIDIKDALAVEKAITALPGAHKGVVVYFVIYPGQDPFKVAKKLAIKRWSMDGLFAKAMSMIANTLTRHEIPSINTIKFEQVQTA